MWKCKRCKEEIVVNEVNSFFVPKYIINGEYIKKENKDFCYYRCEECNEDYLISDIEDIAYWED